MPKPSKTEFAAFYQRYMDLISDDVDIIEFIRVQKIDFLNSLRHIEPEQGDFAYAPGKWSIKQLLGHINDTERIMGYRALSIARGEEQSLPGFDQDKYVVTGQFEKRKLSNLISEFEALREANLLLFETFSEEEINKTGMANNYFISVNALLHIIAGHVAHHSRILKEKYGMP
ncbi:MAG: DinB family protein [Ignavibacteriaceae bacterium]|nr:DinB family protein [Ignavibacteriaceae bacterium]